MNRNSLDILEKRYLQEGEQILVNIKKRDGRIEIFDKEKIIKAISSAMNECNISDIEYCNKIADKIQQINTEIIDVEKVQDIIELELMKSKYKNVAKIFIKYREQRNQERQKNNRLNKQIENILLCKNIENQNANVDEYSFSGRKFESANALHKELALNTFIRQEVSQAHRDNRIYFHDLSEYTIGDHNCIEENGWINYKDNNGIKIMQLKDLNNLYGLKDGEVIRLTNKAYVMGRNGWTKLNAILKRRLKDNEEIFSFKTQTGLELKTTGNHKIPVIRENKEILLLAKDLRTGDILLSMRDLIVNFECKSDNFINLLDLHDEDLNLRIINLPKLDKYIKYKYDKCLYELLGKKHFYKSTDSISINEFKSILSKIDIPFDVFLELRIKAHGSKNSFPLIIPYTEELAKLYGYIYADGGVYINKERSAYQLTFTNTNEKLMDDFIDCFENCFDIQLNKNYPNVYDNSPCIRTTCGSRILVKLFKDFAGAKKINASDMSIPDFIMSGSDNIKLAFLSSCYDTDGHLGNKQVIYTTSSQRYAEQFTNILQSLGYHATRNLLNEKGSSYKFGSKTGIRNYDSYNIILSRNDEIFDLYSKMNTYKRNDSYEIKNFNKNFKEDKIIQINTNYYNINVYDLETESHWFIVNDYVVHNCLFVDVQRLLKNGFSTRNGDVRPANSFNTACQLVAVIFQIQSQVQFGGVASAHIDYDLAPYVKKTFAKKLKDGLKWVENIEEDTINNVPNEVSILDEYYALNYPKSFSYALEMTEKEGLQSCQALFHNINTLESRAGSQVPFSSFNYGRDTSPEGRKVSEWLLKSSIDGIGNKHMTPIFPISIFQYKKGNNDAKGTPNYDLKQLAIKSLSKRIYPNIVNSDWSQNKEIYNNSDTYMASMGCRSLIGFDRHGFGYSKVGRGNVVPITINLPKIGIKSGICLNKREKADLNGFWEELNEVLHLTEIGLVDRFYHICNQNVKSATFMYENGTIVDFEQSNFKGIYESMKHNTLSIGYIGIAEMCQALFDKDHSEDDNVHKFALSVVEYINKFAKECSEKHNLNFVCYASPAENLCKTYAKALKKEFGKIPKVTDRDYITNSHHVPVWQKISIHKKLELEAPFCKYPTGGCITYVELDTGIMNNHKAIEDIIDYAMSIDIPYLAFNFPIDTCMKCGYQGEIDYNCPICGNTNIQRLRRVTGYLSTDYRNFNEGKIKECLDRIKHSNYSDFTEFENIEY